MLVFIEWCGGIFCQHAINLEQTLGHTTALSCKTSSLRNWFLISDKEYQNKNLSTHWPKTQWDYELSPAISAIGKNAPTNQSIINSLWSAYINPRFAQRRWGTEEINKSLMVLVGLLKTNWLSEVSWTYWMMLCWGFFFRSLVWTLSFIYIPLKFSK